MFIRGSCDIRFLCSNMRIEAFRVSYHVEFTSKDFEIKRVSYEENTKVLRQFMKPHTNAHEGVSSDIRFFCSNRRIEAYGASYHMEFKSEDFGLEGTSYEENTKNVRQFVKPHTRAHE